MARRHHARDRDRLRCGSRLMWAELRFAVCVIGALCLGVASGAILVALRSRELDLERDHAAFMRGRNHERRARGEDTLVPPPEIDKLRLGVGAYDQQQPGGPTA